MTVACISEEYRQILVNLVDQNTPKDVLMALVKGIPACTAPTAEAVEKAKEEAKRKVPEIWGIEPIYVDENGKSQTFSSPSALVKHLNLPMSGIQCDIEGKKCKASSAIDILRVHGYTVSGDGEPRKKAQGGTKLTVYHPDAIKTEEKK
jgi:hypothetical protein